MLPKSLLLLASAALAAASPLARRPGGRPNHGTGRRAPCLPVNGGDQELPQPPKNTSLKAIVLGFGIQNYTCAGEGAEPKATGALAMLYDITKLYPGQSPFSLDIDTFNGLTSEAIWNLDVPLNLVADINISLRSPHHRVLPRGADPQNPFPSPSALDLGYDYLEPIPWAGHHFFNANGVPQFRVGDINLLATKLDQVNAPANADAGPDETGAVAWLRLGAVNGSVGAKFVYRVMTTGGTSHGCTTQGEDSTAYTSQYWFYG